MRSVLLLVISIILFSCKTNKDLPIVEKADIEKYSGQWYEIERFTNRFEKELQSVRAYYNVRNNGKIKVLNKGNSFEKNEKFKTAVRTAWMPNTNFPSRLKVSFFGPSLGTITLFH